MQRSKRSPCAENDDRCIEDSYWGEVLPLGFFINSNAVTGGGGGGAAAAATGTKRGMDHGPLNFGSGSGHMIQRSDIPGQKAQNAQASEQTVKASPAAVKTDVSPPAVAAPPPAPAEDSNKVGILLNAIMAYSRARAFEHLHGAQKNAQSSSVYQNLILNRPH